MDSVSLSVQQGEIFGLLGPNGAGKTTLVRLLCTLVLPTSGRARICGHELSDEAAVKACVGLATGEERSFYWRLNGRDNLRFYGALQGLAPDWIERRLAELDRALELREALEKRFDRLSSGMRRRLDLARALLHDPAVVFLDEPTRSLDPAATAHLHGLIRDVAGAGHTVFLVTHRLDEAEALCGRVAIMHRGRLRAVAAVPDLRQAIDSGRRYILTLADGPAVERRPWAIWPWPAQERPPAPPGCLRLEVLLPADVPLEALLRLVRQDELELVDAALEEIPLEEIFQRFTAEEAPPIAVALPRDDGTAAALALPPPQGRSPAVAAQPDNAAAATVPRLPAAVAGLRKVLAFLQRDVQMQISYRLATLLQFAGILFSVTAFYFLAQVFGRGVSPYLAAYGGDYFAFVLIGIAYSAYQAVGLGALSEAIRAGQAQGTLESMLVTPTHIATLLASSALWSFLQATVQVLAYLAVGALLFGLPLGRASVGTALLTLCLSLFAFGGLGMLSASFILVTKRGDPINFLFASLSTLLGGVYYPVEVLPTWLQPVSFLLPMTHAVRAMRRALLEGAGPGQVAPQLALLALFAALTLPAGLVAFRLALRRARLEGSLTQY